MRRVLTSAPIAAACGLVVVTNLAILAAAGWNRRGEPRAELSLTERELTLPGARQDEGTGLELSLRLSHQPPEVLRRAALWKPYELPRWNHAWLDRQKLAELGFRVDLDPTDPDAADHYERMIARRVFLVVEQNGDAWHRWIEGRETEVGRLRDDVAAGSAGPRELADAEALLAIDRTMRSRLFPIDAGVDADELRRRYPDRHLHAVLPAMVRPKLARPDGGPPVLTGEVQGLFVFRVHVPRELRRPLEPLLPRETWREVEARERKVVVDGWPAPSPPRFDAVLAVGASNEPWLESVERRDKS